MGAYARTIFIVEYWWSICRQVVIAHTHATHECKIWSLYIHHLHQTFQVIKTVCRNTCQVVLEHTKAPEGVGQPMSVSGNMLAREEIIWGLRTQLWHTQYTLITTHNMHIPLKTWSNEGIVRVLVCAYKLVYFLASQERGGHLSHWRQIYNGSHPMQHIKVGKHA